MRYSDFNEVKEVYCKLEERGAFPWNEDKEKCEKEYYKFLNDLYENKEINDNLHSDLKKKFADAMISEELKGFSVGIYLILRLKSEMGQDFDNMVKCYKL